MGDLKSPFDQAACPAPSAGEGFSGVPGGLDLGPGNDGVVCSPWGSDHVTPTPSGAMTQAPALGGPPIKFVDTGGGTHEGETLQGDITSTPKRTIDK